MTAITRRTALTALGATAALPFLARGARAATPVHVGALRLVSHAPSFIAQERGYFKDAGLDVSFDWFEAAQPMAIAIASGDTGYGMTAITGGLLSLAQKGVAKVIGGALSEQKGVPGEKILASVKAYEGGLTDPSKLDGKTFGITQPGSSFHYMGSKIAAAVGATVHFKPLQTTGALIGAIKSGQIDAWSIVPNIAEPLAAAGAVKIIGEVADYLPGYQVTTVFSSTKFATQEEAQTKAFMAALSRGTADYNAALVDKSTGAEDLAAISQIIARYVYPDKPADQAVKDVQAAAMRINDGMALSKASVEDQIAWFKDSGLIDNPVTYDQLVDGRYARTLV